MIKSIHLRNFESHRNTFLEFSPGINIIAGASNHGKSSIIRGLYWIKDNKPSGTPMVSFWNRDSKNNPKKSTYVEIVLSDGNTIRRERSPEMNGYILGDTKLEAIGMIVPEEITKVLNLSDINMQYQFDRPFLLDESSSEVARLFNRTIRLDIIDRVQQKAEDLRKSINRDIKNSEERIAALSKQIESYSWIEKAEPLVTELEELIKSIDKDYAEQEEIKKLIEEYELHEANLAKFERISGFKDLTDSIDKYIEEITDGSIEFRKIKNLLEEKEESEERIRKIEKLLSLREIIESIDKIDESIKTYYETKRKIEQLLTDIDESQELINIYAADLKKYSKLLPDTCPLCGHPLDKKEV